MGGTPALNAIKGLRVLVFRDVWVAPDQGKVGVTQLSHRQAKRPRVQSSNQNHTLPYTPRLNRKQKQYIGLPYHYYLAKNM